MSKKIVPFPNTNIPPSDKKEEYYLQVVRAYWDLKQRGMTSFPRDYIDKLRENRAYADGNQSVDRYISFYESSEGQNEVQTIQSTFIDQGTKPEYVREGWGNLDVTNIPTPATKIKLAIHGMFQDVAFYPSLRSNDPRSGEERQKVKWLSYLRAKHSDWFEATSAMADVELAEQDFIPESVAELSLIDAAQGFKLPFEVELEKALVHSFDISNYDEIKSQILDDIIADNRFATKIETCENSHKRIGKYVDLENFSIQYSKFYDHRDSEMAGHWEDVTVGSLARYFKRSELEDIAKQHLGRYGNPERFDDYEGLDSMGFFKYDFFKVKVFYFSFIDYDNDYKVSYKTPYGRAIDRPVRHDYEPKPKETKTRTSVKMLKKVSWVIDTDYVYDFGNDNDLVRPSEKDVLLPYVYVKLPGKSITESAKVYYDDLVHIHLKTMNALITASAAGFAIDAGALEGVSMGGKEVHPLDLFDLYRHKSILVFKRKDQWNQPTTQGIPIMELPGGIGRFLEEQIQLFQHTMHMLETITGINPVTLGGVPEERAAVRNVQMSVQGTENILRPIIRGIKNLKRRMAENFALSIPYLIQTYPASYKAYEKVIGTPGVDLIKMIKDDIYEMGITLEPMLTIAHRESLMEKVNFALQKDAQGQAGLTIDQAMLIEERIVLGAPLKLVRLEIAAALKKAHRELVAERERLASIQGEQTQQLDQQKHQHELQKLDVETQAKMDLDTHQMQNRAKEEYLKSNLALIQQLMEEDDEPRQVTEIS